MGSFYSKPTAVSCTVFGLLLVLQTQSFADDPPLIKAPISKCGAKLEYFSEIKSTGKDPAYQLTNLIRNNGDNLVTDLEWQKPNLSTPELKKGETLEGSYAVSAYMRDKDAPIKFWYQGCEAPAEAYLQQKEKPEKSASLRSIIRRYSDAIKGDIARAEITVSKQPGFIQYEIAQRPQNTIVGLTGIAEWLISDASSAIAASSKEYGYYVDVVPLTKFISGQQLERLHATWGKDSSLITRPAPGGKDYVRVRLPTSITNVEITHAKVVLVDTEGKLIATSSYATFKPVK